MWRSIFSKIELLKVVFIEPLEYLILLIFIRGFFLQVLVDLDKAGNRHPLDLLLITVRLDPILFQIEYDTYVSEALQDVLVAPVDGVLAILEAYFGSLQGVEFYMGDHHGSETFVIDHTGQRDSQSGIVFRRRDEEKSVHNDFIREEFSPVLFVKQSLAYVFIFTRFVASTASSMDARVWVRCSLVRALGP
jgi:hypothetical protein